MTPEPRAKPALRQHRDDDEAQRLIAGRRRLSRQPTGELVRRVIIDLPSLLLLTAFSVCTALTKTCTAPTRPAPSAVMASLRDRATNYVANLRAVR